MSASQAARHTMLLLLALLLISYRVGNIHCSTVPDNSTDRLWLLDFKAVTNDPRQALSSWNSSIPHCEWEGVNCSLTHLGRVTALNLAGKSLQGQIAPSLGNLTFLQNLDLSSNGFFGQLPTLNRLHRLQYISLSNNKLQGFTPDALKNCSNLLYLDLSANSLKGSLPTKIGTLSSLASLNLGDNNFSGIIPSSLHNITNLMGIDLSSNEFQGSIPEELGQLHSMVVLSLGGNRLSGRIPTTILNHSALAGLDLSANFLQMELPSNIGDTLPNLHQLFLHHNMFQGRIPASLGNAPKLNHIDFTSNSFTGQVPSSLGKLSSLTYLKLESNKLEANDSKSWEFLDALSNCSSLQLLSLYDNLLQGAIPYSVGKLSAGLEYLSLDTNKLSGTVPESIGNLTGLISLSLAQNNLSGPTGWVGNLKKLGVVSLSENNFAGPIPSSISGLTQLTKLFLYGNKFEGSMPPSLGNLPALSVLILSHNNLNGHIPIELFSHVSTLTTCILSYNNLEGPIPSELSNLKQLTELHLSSNKLSGEIPATLGDCSELQILEMDNNLLTGNIPKTLGSLKSLTMLNLSHNNLSGFIPIELSNMLFLTQLDLSNNSLEGEIPTKGVFGNVSAVSLGGNWGLCGGSPDLHMPLCPGGVSHRSETEYYLVRALIPVFGITSLVMLTFIITGNKKTRGTYMYLLSFGRRFNRVSYTDLSQATMNFSEANLLGSGSYGSVYRGKLTQAKIQVAIKVFDLDMKCADKSFVTECDVLRSIRHRNLLPILTACSTIDNNGDDFRALIFEYMPNGNLDTWLHGIFADGSSECLSLAQRASIAVGIADALSYLHHDCERIIVHCDLKPTNILLDDDMNAYLGDFGIASLVGHSSSTTSAGLKGTIGYIAPEYAQSGQASIHGDVYSFGIVLLEMLIGRRPTDPMFENELNLVNFAERNYPDQILHITDARLQGECEGYIQANITMKNSVYECLLLLMQVALSCTCLIPRERMDIREVANKLHSITTSYIRTIKKEEFMVQ